MHYAVRAAADTPCVQIKLRMASPTAEDLPMLVHRPSAEVIEGGNEGDQELRTTDDASSAGMASHGYTIKLFTDSELTATVIYIYLIAFDCRVTNSNHGLIVVQATKRYRRPWNLSFRQPIDRDLGGCRTAGRRRKIAVCLPAIIHDDTLLSLRLH